MRCQTFSYLCKLAMNTKIVKIFSVLTVLLCNVSCELSPDAVANLLHTYSTNVNTSITLSKSDRRLLNSWSDEFQIKRVNVTTKYRLQMLRHKDHSFKKEKLDKKWVKCIDVYTAEIDASERMYYENESGCLKTVNTEDKEKRKALDQIEKEIKHWRKSYRYLIHLCNVNHPDDETAAGACLVEYIEKDGYNITLLRLMVMKLDAMAELYLKLTTSMANLEECLKINLSAYLDTVRTIMESLNRCYSGKREEKHL